MCKAIYIDHARHGSAQSLIDAGYVIPDDALTRARLVRHFERVDGDLVEMEPTGELYGLNDCFCAVDAHVILDGLGLTYTVDDIGDLVVTT